MHTNAVPGRTQLGEGGSKGLREVRGPHVAAVRGRHPIHAMGKRLPLCRLGPKGRGSRRRHVQHCHGRVTEALGLGGRRTGIRRRGGGRYMDTTHLIRGCRVIRRIRYPRGHNLWGGRGDTVRRCTRVDVMAPFHRVLVVVAGRAVKDEKWTTHLTGTCFVGAPFSSLVKNALKSHDACNPVKPFRGLRWNETNPKSGHATNKYILVDNTTSDPFSTPKKLSRNTAPLQAGCDSSSP